MKSIIFTLFILISCSKSKDATKVHLIKQWHLSPNQNTLDIEKSKNLPQYLNQKEIYLKVQKMIKDGQTSTILAEGCDSKEVDTDFEHKYNGWNIGMLKKEVMNPLFESIMAPVHMKIKVKYPHVKVLCADSSELITKNLTAFSETKGNLSFYQALKKNKESSREKFKLYASKLQELHPTIKISNPLEFSLEESIRNLHLFEKLVIERNKSFLKSIIDTLEDRPVLIVGGLHVDDLVVKLNQVAISSEVITPKGYDNKEQELLLQLKKILKSERRTKVIYYQVPPSFDIKNFKTANLISAKELYTSAEAIELKSIMDIANLDFSLIRSDFDNDGIRDFTVSKGGNKIVISAEDSDWDNDGIDNIIDNTLADISLSKTTTEPSFSNVYLSKSKPIELLKWFKENKINISQSESSDHDLLVLDVFQKVLSLGKVKSLNLKHIKSTQSLISYGEKVFFSYIRQSKTIEYYPIKLRAYIENIKQKMYPNNSKEEFVRGFVLPLIVHSFVHELIHATSFDFYSFASQNGWEWKERAYNGKYLKSHRLKAKEIAIVRSHYRYKKKTFDEWVEEFNKYPKAKSFLIDHKLASLYSLESPSEWFAESMAMCLVKDIFPSATKSENLIGYTKLLGINPSMNLLCNLLK